MFSNYNNEDAVVVEPANPCENSANCTKSWAYHQYYVGEKSENTRNGQGTNHWTGAESQENYCGLFLRDTMHGMGEYRWRHREVDDVSATYEGHFFGNTMHGYGVMSYQNGDVFKGLFFTNMRWGPGVQTQVCLQEDVGLWRGTQLVRLTWSPATATMALDLKVNPIGVACVDPHRIMLVAGNKIICEVNSAIELLKQSGSEPMHATETWQKLYPEHCNDLYSQMCNIKLFQDQYYDNQIPYLEETSEMPQLPEEVDLSNTGAGDTEVERILPATYYAWNNNPMVIHMMKHCFTHDSQREEVRVDLQKILTGPRSEFKKPGTHELQCRTLLMASYLGYTKNVTQLVNECNVHPNVSDNMGNNAIMYATCGNQTDIIQFLFEAGGVIDNFNDCCCTPLGIALVRFACTRNYIACNDMVQSLLPTVLPDSSSSPDENIPKEMPLEWNMNKSADASPSPNKEKGKPVSAGPKKTKSADDIKKKSTKSSVGEFKIEDLSEDIRTYLNVDTEYCMHVNDQFSVPSGVTPIPYLFAIDDMAARVTLYAETESKPAAVVPNAKNKQSEVKMYTELNPSKDALYKSLLGEESITSIEKERLIMLSRMMSTIVTLLRNGANPSVVRCPQPAMIIAIMSGSPELVQTLANYGANVNEVYPEHLNYTPLDVAVSKNLSFENFEIIRALLESGARTDHVIHFRDQQSLVPGPGLLLAVLAKTAEEPSEQEIQKELLRLLLQFGCDPSFKFLERTPVDYALEKNMEILDIFIKCPRTDLNAGINAANQTILLKLFSMGFFQTVPEMELLQTLTSLLLYGADPFLPCTDGTNEFENTFTCVRRNLDELNNAQAKTAATAASAAEGKGKKGKNEVKPEKSKMEAKVLIPKVPNAESYSQAVDLLAECSRTLMVRWIQGKLFKELLEIVMKYKHRHWNMIIPEHKNKSQCSLWLTSPQCMEIWNILETSKRKQRPDRVALKHLLCIVHLYHTRFNIEGDLLRSVTWKEKNSIELYVAGILHEEKDRNKSMDKLTLTRSYVQPEIATKDAEQKYDVCFECLLPLSEERETKIICFSCDLVWFCSLECMQINIDGLSFHPCSTLLKNHYFPTPSESIASEIDNDLLT